MSSTTESAMGPVAADGAKPKGPNIFAPDALDRHLRQLQSAVPLLIFGMALFVARPFQDGDTGWHLGAGRWIVEHRSIPLTDPFSHTFAGAPWVAHEWLAEVLMAAAERVGGWVGLMLLFAVPCALTAWIIARQAFRYLPARYALTAVALSGGLLMNFAVARPHVFSWPLLAAWTVILLRARDRNGAPPMAVALLMVVWANLHASYMFALGLAALFGLESLLANRRDGRLLGRWLLFGVASALAALATPLGPSHLLYPFQVSNMEALSLIGEWRRSVPQTDAHFYLCAVGTMVLIFFRWRSIPPLRILLLLGLIVMAVLHARHQMLFGIVGVLVALPMLNPAKAPEPPLRATAWLLPGLLALAIARVAIPYEFPQNGVYPLDLIAKVPPEVRRQPVYNEYSQGGPLVMLGVRPYIDGRADMYGDAFTFRATAITRGDLRLFREDAARYRIGWVLLQRDDVLAVKLTTEPGWRRLLSDEHAIVFVRAK